AGVRGELGRRAPLAEVRVVEAAPVLGAVLLGMDAVGAGVGAYERVRGWFG
ncbi:ATPase, partial [Streptomyces sp. ZG43]